VITWIFFIEISSVDQFISSFDRHKNGKNKKRMIEKKTYKEILLLEKNI